MDAYWFFTYCDWTLIDLIASAKFEKNQKHIESAKLTSAKHITKSRCYIGTKRSKGKKPRRVMIQAKR